ncbi:MAG: hypothetical protein ABIP39_12050 [Polyangiaceae bacterium]
MMRPFFTSSLVLLLGAASVACSSTIDVGRDVGDGGPGSDARSVLNDADSGTSGKDATAAGSSKTKSGASCESADLPPAGSACTIPGTYVVTESLCSSTDATCMDPAGTTDYVWTANVTLTGTTVKLTNGTDRLLHCELTPPCTCLSSSGKPYHFTETGFTTIGGSQCAGTATQGELDVGVKQ